MLTVRDLQVSYGQVTAVRGISFNVEKGELVTIIGANGAGKTSTLNAIIGLVPVHSGEITLQDVRLDTLPVEQRIALGLGLSPEGRRVFKTLSVLDNLRAGGNTLALTQLEQRIDAVLEQFPVLRERRQQDAGTLSGGEQQMLAIARALIVQPSFLVLDEPSLGLAPKIVTQVFELISQLHQSGVTILLVEQNIHKSLAISDRAYVMELGTIVRFGTAQEIASDPQIHKSYFGATG